MPGLPTPFDTLETQHINPELIQRRQTGSHFYISLASINTKVICRRRPCDKSPDSVRVPSCDGSHEEIYKKKKESMLHDPIKYFPSAAIPVLRRCHRGMDGWEAVLLSQTLAELMGVLLKLGVWGKLNAHP